MSDSNDRKADLAMRLEGSGILKGGLVEPGHENLNPANMLRTVYFWENKGEIEKSNVYRTLLVLRWPLSSEAIIAAEESAAELRSERIELAQKVAEKIPDYREWFRTGRRTFIRKVALLAIVILVLATLLAVFSPEEENPLVIVILLLLNIPLIMLVFEECPNCRRHVHQMFEFWGFPIIYPFWWTGFPKSCPYCRCRFK